MTETRCFFGAQRRKRTAPSSISVPNFIRNIAPRLVLMTREPLTELSVPDRWEQSNFKGAYSHHSPLGDTVIIIDVKDPRGFDLSADAECLQQLERQALPSYLLDQRWYGAKSDVPPVVRVDQSIHFGPSSWIFILAVTAQQEQRHYFVPVNANWDAPLPTDGVIAELRSESSRGWLIDAFGNDGFVCGLLRGISTGSIEEADGLIFKRSTSFNPAPGFPDQVQITRPGAEQSNTSIVAGSVILKAYRRLEEGIHPEVEVGAFLTDTVGFGNVPEMLGTIEHVRSGANESAVLACCKA